MMVYGIPVGKMFRFGAPKLLNAHASILPCRLTGDNRILVETYPALVARRLIGRMVYKNESRDNQELESHRGLIIHQICHQFLQRDFDLSIQIADEVALLCIQDHKGDHLDALLCSIQAAWAYTNYSELVAYMEHIDSNEGWIMDPGLIQKK
jgi:hypothetical protein